MNGRDEERLHERLMNGTADPGMYPDCAEHIGMLDRGREDELAREAAQLEDAQTEELSEIEAAGYSKAEAIDILEAE